MKEAECFAGLLAADAIRETGTFTMNHIKTRKTGHGLRVGSKRGRLKVLGNQFSIRQDWYAVTRCDCGTVKVIKTRYIATGHSTSCGCWQRRDASQRMVGMRWFGRVKEATQPA